METVISKVRKVFEDNHLRLISTPSLRLSPAPVHGVNPGCLYVKDAANNYVGKITADNHFRTMTPTVPQAIQDELRVIAVGGIEALKLLGKLSGFCSFCGRQLDDPDSVERGYGPVCAKKYHLAHPNRHGF